MGMPEPPQKPGEPKPKRSKTAAGVASTNFSLFSLFGRKGNDCSALAFYVWLLPYFAGVNRRRSNNSQIVQDITNTLIMTAQNTEFRSVREAPPSDR